MTVLQINPPVTAEDIIYSLPQNSANGGRQATCVGIQAW